MPSTMGLFHHQQQLFAVATANATPSATVAFGQVPQGYIWYIEVYSAHVSGGHTAILEVAALTTNTVPANWDRNGRLNLISAATDNGQSPSNPFFVDAGLFVVFSFTAGTLAQNDTVAVNMQIAVHELDPAYIRHGMSAQDLRQFQAEHERLGSLVTQPATAVTRATDGTVGEDLHIVDPDPFVGSPG